MMKFPLRYSCKAVERYRVEINKIALKICDLVYTPSEDTWLTLEVAENTVEEKYKQIELFVDVGTGTGILGLYLLEMKKVFTLMIDINPCALSCSLENTKRNNYHYLVEIVQCDSVTCIRPSAFKNAFIVYNTPYLPVADNTLEGLAWSGGLNEFNKILKILTVEARGHFICLVVTYSSLSGSDTKLLEELRSNYNVVSRSRHYFFEDIKVVVICK